MRNARLLQVKQFCVKKNLSFLLIEKPTDLFYLTDLSCSVGKLFITKEEECLFVDKRYTEAAKKSFSPVQVLSDENSKEYLLAKKNTDLRIGFDSSFTTYASFEKLKKLLQELGKNFELIPILNPLKEIRAVKDQGEILSLKKAASIAYRGVRHVQSILQEGMTEKDLAVEFEVFCLKNGSERMAFDPIVSFGENTAMPHHRPSLRRLEKNDVVLMDVGAVVDGYHSDLTRMFFLGEGNFLLKEYYALVQRAHREALSLCKKGKKVGDVDRAARDLIASCGLDALFFHSLGHGVGLEVHESPRMKFDSEDKDLVLKKGMVFTIEPGIYKEGVGGVRYEDMILITDEGYENFYEEENVVF